MRKLVLLCACLAPAYVLALPCEADLRPWRAERVEFEGPQGVTVDTTDGTLWVTSATSVRILHLSADLEVIERFQAPFEPALNAGITGIAYNSTDDTLFLVRPVAKEVVEVEKHAPPETPGVLSPTGRVIVLSLDPPPNIIPEPFPKGIAFHPMGDGGLGSIWVVEAVMTKIYELSLDTIPRILNEFCHPDDPDGCPGEGDAAQSFDVDLVWRGGEPIALDITGGTDRRDRIHRVEFDGERTGLSYPLVGVGGKPAGFAHAEVRDPSTGGLRDVYYVAVESSAELHVMEILDHEILPPLDLQCEEVAGTVELHWRNTDSYDQIVVGREGSPLATLEASTDSYTDVSPPDGVLEYEIVVTRGACESSVSCSLVSGAGRVLASTFLEAHALDMTEDSRGLFWVAFVDNSIRVVDESFDFSSAVEFPGPFQDEEDVTSGIAHNPETDTFFVLNAETQVVAEIDTAGELVGEPFPSGLPEEAVVPSMLFNPAGEAGNGSFWYVDVVSGTIQERSRAGELLRSCVHPDQRAEEPPGGEFTVCGKERSSAVRTFLWGITSVPGTDFELIEVAGGTARDGRATRALRINMSTCEATGFEIPLDEAATYRAPYAIGLHRPLDGRPIIYVNSQFTFHSSWFLTVDARPPPVPHVTALRCAQEGPARDVRLSFVGDGSLDAVEVLRDGAELVTLGSDTGTYLDVDVPAGYHTYRLRGVQNGERGDDRTCSLQVGIGSIAARQFTAPVAFLHELAYDPTEEIYVAASNANSFSDCLYRFDRDFNYLGDFDAPFPRPMQVAALAVRVTEGRSETYCLGWRPGATPGAQPKLPLRVLDAAGDLQRELELLVPQPPGTFVTFPAGMTWDAATDTFWLLARNARTVMNFAPDGEAIATFVHPAPIFQDLVQSFGLAIDPGRRALYLASADAEDYEVTKIVEVTTRGELTGVEIPVGSRFYTKVRGFDLAPSGIGLVVSSTRGNVSDLVEYRAFDALPPVRSLSCVWNAEGIALHWENAAAYDSLTVYRRREKVATLAGGATSWLDTETTLASVFYSVVAHQGELTSAGALCEYAIDRPLIRGDVEENRQVNLSDAIVTLNFLFLGEAAPSCLDAADVDDSGDVNITDAIGLLTFLFLSGRAPEPPFPLPGYDRTADSLTCTP